eukprot:7848851-Ditylum_brightwellii.AAC.2
MAEERELWGHIVKRAGLGILDPTSMTEHCYAMSRACCDVLGTSLVEGKGMQYAAHRACMRESSAGAQKAQAVREKVALDQMRKDQPEAVGSRLDRGTETGAWLTVIPNHLNCTELSQEEFRDNLRLRYCMIPLRL